MISLNYTRDIIQAMAARRITRGDAPAMRFLLRLPATLHASLTAGAARRELSLNEYIGRRLAGLEAHPAVEAVAAVVLARARDVVRGALVGALLHGSWSRGEARADSDIDALIVVDRSLPLSRGLYRAWDEQPVAVEGRAVDVHFVHLPTTRARAGGVWCEAAIEGRLIADRAGRIEDTLIELRRAIADGRLVRKRAHGQPYWTVAA
jgi:predicted nucleotidyltransferase